MTAKQSVILGLLPLLLLLLFFILKVLKEETACSSILLPQENDKMTFFPTVCEMISVNSSGKCCKDVREMMAGFVDKKAK